MEKIMAVVVIFAVFQIMGGSSAAKIGDSLAYVWPLPAEFTFGGDTLSVDPGLVLVVEGKGGNSSILRDGFERYSRIIFEQSSSFSILQRFRGRKSVYDVRRLRIIVHSASEELQLGVDESYTLFAAKTDGKSIVQEVVIEANTVYGALRGLETFSQLCAFDYDTRVVQIYKAPWYIRDKPRFAYRGLLIDTSRHYLPIEVIKQIIDSMSYAKLNVLHWHIIDEQSFPLEVPTYSKLWKGSYTKWERYTVDDAHEIVNFAKSRGIHVMAEIDVPGHGESWGVGYSDLWPSKSCREPLDVSKNFTFDVLSGILTDMRKIFPFELFHLGGDEVNAGASLVGNKDTVHLIKEIEICGHKYKDTICATSAQWMGCSVDYVSIAGTLHHTSSNGFSFVFDSRLQDHNMTPKDAYKYFVLRAQEMAISKGWTPVNWEETFNAFPSSLSPKTIVHNWLGGGVCPKAVSKGFKCIFSNRYFWYLDYLHVPWDDVYTAEPVEGISNSSEQELVLGGEVCMWGETADTSVVQQTIWPRAAAAAERLWSKREATSSGNITLTALPRLHYFRCLLNRRGVPAAPVTNSYARNPPIGPGSCYVQ